jgi:hypothetical protein
MKLIADWRACLNRLWTVRIALFAAFLPFADQILAQFERYIPPWLYSLLFLAIIAARMFQQKAPPDPEATAPGK